MIAPTLWSFFPLTVKATPLGALDLTSRLAKLASDFVQDTSGQTTEIGLHGAADQRRYDKSPLSRALAQEISQADRWSANLKRRTTYIIGGLSDICESRNRHDEFSDSPVLERERAKDMITK